MKNQFTKEFRDIILKCQELRKTHDIEYEENCKEEIESFSKQIIEQELIEKQQDKNFAMQLCIVNGLNYRT